MVADLGFVGRSNSPISSTGFKGAQLSASVKLMEETMLFLEENKIYCSSHYLWF